MADNTYKGMTNSGTKKQIPKNLRQIGKINEGLKIYMEDYVKTFVRQLAESEPENVTAAILVGEYVKIEDDRNLFLYGAIQLLDIWQEDAFIFTEDTWTSIYETIKQYFPEGEIAGWYLRKNEWTERNYDIVEEVHLDNFAGKDKVLLQHDLLEKDGEFLCYESGALIPQSGYFIYYDKNVEMQNYMIDHKQVKKEEEYVEDRAVKEFRTIYQEKHPQEKKDAKKTVLRMSYAAGLVVVFAVSAVAITAMNNSDKMKDLEETLETISNSIAGKDASPSEEPSENIFDNVGSQDTKTPERQESADADDSIQSAEDGQELEQGGTDEGEDLAEDPNIDWGGQQAEEEGADSASSQETGTGEGKEQTAGETGTPGNEEPDNVEVLQPLFTPDQLTSYLVEAGDTLAGICYRMYGNSQYLKIIQEMNQIADENKIFIGQQLIIPK